jgi:hypothetical protein
LTAARCPERLKPTLEGSAARRQMLTQASATLNIGQLFALLGIIVGGMIVAGGVVILGRHVLSSTSDGDQGSLIRSWIAIALVMGLLIFCAAALYLPDDAIRSTMFGGLIASVGAAVAFYFSSQGADQARSDVLNTAVALSQGPLAPTAFTAKAPPAGTVDAAYGPYTFAANGVPKPTFSLESGDLPAGLILAADGSVSGKPTAAGSGTFVVRAINVAGHTDSPSITITIDPAA